uniref:CASPASE_P20 domain-containing protein n=1 Tax=Macrostomum lignano TaxID=282301 RepID=A0A1I8F665_9PLAT
RAGHGQLHLPAGPLELAGRRSVADFLRDAHPAECVPVEQCQRRVIENFQSFPRAKNNYNFSR